MKKKKKKAFFDIDYNGQIEEEKTQNRTLEQVRSMFEMFNLFDLCAQINRTEALVNAMGGRIVHCIVLMI